MEIWEKNDNLDFFPNLGACFCVFLRVSRFECNRLFPEQASQNSLLHVTGSFRKPVTVLMCSGNFICWSVFLRVWKVAVC